MTKFNFYKVVWKFLQDIEIVGISQYYIVSKIHDIHENWIKEYV